MWPAPSRQSLLSHGSEDRCPVCVLGPTASSLRCVTFLAPLGSWDGGPWSGSLWAVLDFAADDSERAGVYVRRRQGSRVLHPALGRGSSHSSLSSGGAPGSWGHCHGHMYTLVSATRSPEYEDRKETGWGERGAEEVPARRWLMPHVTV